MTINLRTLLGCTVFVTFGLGGEKFASAQEIASAAFQPMSSADAPYISHNAYGGAAVFNNDTASYHSSVAPIGVYWGETGGKIETFIAGFLNGTAMTRYLSSFDLSLYTFSTGTVWNSGTATGNFNAGVGINVPLAHPYAVNLYCQMPPRNSGTATYIYGTF